MAQHRQGLVDDGHVGTHADGRVGGVVADRAAADDYHPARFHAGYAAQQHTAAAMGFFERSGAGLDAHASSHFRHRGEQWQAAAGGGNRLVSNGSGTAGEDVLGLAGIRCQVQVGEQQVVGLEAGALLGNGLLDLDDHRGQGKDFLGIEGDFGTGPLVVAVTGADAVARSRLDVDLMAVGDDFAHRAGGQADPVFVVLCFPWNAYFHDFLRVWVRQPVIT